MLETSARLLRLLSLLQAVTDWTGPQLADRLGVTTRTVRKDVERLRALGYPVRAGAALPPLLLDDDEAVAVAIGLRTAAGGTVSGIGESSLRALAKLEKILPARLRHRVGAVSAATVAVPAKGPRVSADTLTALAAAVRDRMRVRFDYESHDGARSVRIVEPYRLVNAGRRWYLVAWDVDRAGWRTFRVDRIAPHVPTGPRFTPREPPDGDLTAWVARRLGTATWRLRAEAVVHAPAGSLAARLPPEVEITPRDALSCVVQVGSDNALMLALHLGMIGADFTVTGPPELVAQLGELSARFARAVSP